MYEYGTVPPLACVEIVPKTPVKQSIGVDVPLKIKGVGSVMLKLCTTKQLAASETITLKDPTGSPVMVSLDPKFTGGTPVVYQA